MPTFCLSFRYTISDSSARLCSLAREAQKKQQQFQGSSERRVNVLAHRLDHGRLASENTHVEHVNQVLRVPSA
jgi:hypothetical protein